jgi:ATP-dependent helicase/nuclease subunit A
MAFQDAVLDYSQKEAGGAGLFANWWDENSGRFSVSSSDRQDAIRIMTIHKAKGLQFKVVVIPFGDWRTDHNPMHDNFIWCRPDREPFSRLSLVPVKYKAELAGSIFVNDYFNEKMQVFVDNLNLLYVAFTRSEEELHVCAPMPGENRKNRYQVKSVSELLYIILSEYPVTHDDWKASADGPSTESSVVRDSLTGLPGYWNDREKIFTAGSRGTPPRIEADTGNELMLEKYRVNYFRDKLKLRIYGNLFFDGEGKAGKRIAHGRLMHEIFEKIITADDVEKAVMGKYHEGMIFAEEVVPLAGEIKKLISDKRIAHWYSGSRKVRNETGILLKTGKTRRPDRVMISEGEVVVADYKFGEHNQPGYAGQVRRYMKELKNMGYKNVKGFVWYVLSGELDEVKLNTDK